jgi:hypothetical protein
MYCRCARTLRRARSTRSSSVLLPERSDPAGNARPLTSA